MNQKNNVNVFRINKTSLTSFDLILGGIVCFRLVNRLVSSNMAATCILSSTLLLAIYFYCAKMYFFAWYVSELYLWRKIILRKLGF